MFRISSQADLLECFRISERDEVAVPESSRFPILVRDYFSWVEPSGAKTFLVFSDAGGKNPLGIVFRRSSSSSLCMCEWCHSVGGGEGVAMLTAAASATRRVGMNVCSDLSCATKIRASLQDGPGVNDIPDRNSERVRVRAVVERMSKFVRQNIF